MIKYREHRGSLDESLKTSMKFETIKELFEFIIEKHPLLLKIENFRIYYYGFDKRCNHELYVVTYLDTENKECGVFGFIYEEVK